MPPPKRPSPKRPSAGVLRVVAGEAGGRRLAVPPGTRTRPTSDRVREAVFNALDSLGAVEDARVIDAFAGSGALGIEALSRGADHVTFAERERDALEVLRSNLEAVGLGGSATVVAGDASSAVGRGQWDLVLLDPPYDFDGWPDLLALVARVVADDGVVVIESDREVAVPAPLHVIRAKRYGSTVVLFAAPHGADQ